MQEANPWREVTVLAVDVFPIRRGHAADGAVDHVNLVDDVPRDEAVDRPSLEPLQANSASNTTVTIVMRY